MIVYGAGGMGREVADELKPNRFDGFLFDGPEGTRHVVDGSPFVAAVGDGRLREALALKGQALGLRLASFVSRDAGYSYLQEFPPGCMVMRGACLTCNVKLGLGVLLNTGCIIPHDCELGDWSTVQPGAVLTGRVHVGKYATIGAGATIVCRSNSEPLVIGEGAVVGAGAVVLHDVEPGTTVVGVPAHQVVKV